MNTDKLPIEYITKSANAVKKFAYIIAVVGAVASFGTQVELLQSWGITTAFSIMIPLTVDLLAICAAIGLQVPNLPTEDRKSIGWIMVTALTVSITANMISGHNLGSRIAHAWPVVAYMLAEYIANKLRTYVAYVLAQQEEKEAQRVAAQQAQRAQQAEQAEKSVEQQIKRITEQPISKRAMVQQIASVSKELTIPEIAEYAATSQAWVRACLKSQ